MNKIVQKIIILLFLFSNHFLLQAQVGIWTSAAELSGIPVSGPAWEAVKNGADQNFYPPVIADNNHNSNVYCLAAAIVYARTGDASYKDRVVNACERLVQNGKPGSNTLRWARNTGAFALAADLVGYRTVSFENWLRNMAEGYQDDRPETLLAMFKRRPNNWGTQAFGSLCAIYSYLGDTLSLPEIRDYWILEVTGPKPPGLDYGDLSWHVDPDKPRLINPKGAEKEELNIDGIIPDDMRRNGTFINPPPKPTTSYHWEVLQGIIMAAWILERAGIPIWDVADSAIFRTGDILQVQWENEFGSWKAEGDDLWMLPFYDHAYGTNWSVGQPDRMWEHGKNTGWPYVLLAEAATYYDVSVNVIGSGNVTLSPPGGIYAEGTDVTLTAISDLGWVFDHWTGDFEGSDNPASISVDTSMTITTIFNELPQGQVELRVTTSGSGSISVNPSGPVYVKGTVLTLTAKPESGWIFSSWSGGLTSFDNPDTFIIDTHTTIIAKFIPQTYYNLNVNLTGSGTVMLDPSGGTYSKSSVVTLSSIPAAGWIFDCWDGDLKGTENPETITMSSDKEVTANFIVEYGFTTDLLPTDDSYTRGGTYADFIFNNASFLRVNHGTEQKYHRHTYLKFDLKSINNSVKYAVLKLTVKDGGLKSGIPARADVYSVLDDNWSETTITWNNAPAYGTFFDSEADIRSEGKTYTWDITGFVVSEMAGDKVVSLMLKDNGQLDRRIDFYRREDIHPPVLTIMQDTSGNTVSDEIEIVPQMYKLYQNIPNPFNPSTCIRYELYKASHVKLVIYNIYGRVVETLVEGLQNSGIYEYEWKSIKSDDQGIPSGIYFYQIRINNYVKTMKMILLR
jgi:hypothetical protein